VKRVVAAVLVLMLGLAFVGLLAFSAKGAAPSYSVKEGRAYAYKVSLDEDVFENIPACNPDEDPYKCDYSRYNHKPNCPQKMEIGRAGKAVRPQPPPDVKPTSGGAGDGAGSEPAKEAPPQSSPVRFNRIISSAAVSHLFDIREASGFAGQTWVDLSGVRDPEAFSQTNAFSQQAKWEERCYPREQAEAKDSYAHVLSRSEKRIETYHLSECNKRACTFEAPTPGTVGASAERARSIVHLFEEDGEVRGIISSVVEDLSYGDGAFTVDSLRTFARFSSDGTQGGLEWSVASTASGAKLGGQPISLPPGEMVSLPGFSVGVAAPYVDAPKDGSRLTIVAAGLTIAHEKQAQFFGGAELYASFGESVGFGPLGGVGPSDIGGGGGLDFGGGKDLGGSGSISLGGGGAGGGARIPIADNPPVASGPAEELLIYRVATGRGAAASIVALGMIMALLLGGRWMQRFAWGRRMTRLQPFKAIDWIYRAFVKT
jgi:hypothetical protein